MSTIPNSTLSNGYKVPVLGLGTWKSKPGEVTTAVQEAIDIGYRHIDCAFVYGNEKEVGIAIKNKIAEGKVKREDLFVTSKLWNTYHRPDLVEVALKTSLANLQLDYLDLYLIHWPLAYKEEAELFPVDEHGKIIPSDVHYTDTWKAMEPLVEKGLVKSLGLSNFNKRQIEDIFKVAKINPVMLQFECHPYLSQKRLIEFCKSKNLCVTAYSPLGSPDRPWAQPNDPVLLDDPKLKDIALKYGKSTAQILIRYQIQQGAIPIPKSVTKARLLENFNVFDFELANVDMNLIDGFNCNGRICPMTPVRDHPHHPFANDDF